ncbi:hypothetical protein FBZ85_109143 [Azospirillum brasilense]|uniref:Uncharacterized protein n=1 Tax=Azospirillum baldaniorum TaxID=1064539 RepID=A0A9P1JYT8_9PROT|nr:hypothetical protein FBZ84_112122 [Azospirillum baldaniorum]TWA76240.1 hypothetical protein FBZ85_109143 [Azospirillum brasilense]CCD02428.1 protein of unknown function [Azospirillum baldaniorum]
MKPQRSAPRPSSPFARPDGSCLGRLPDEEDEPVPAAPAEPEDTPVPPTEPMNPA